MSELRARMIEPLPLHRKALGTQEQYVQAIAQLAAYYKRSPDQFSPQEIRAYLHSLLTERQLAWSSCNVVAAAIRFFYVDTLGWTPMELHLPPRPPYKQLPRVLSYRLLSEHLLLELRAYWQIECPRPWLFPGSKTTHPMPSGTAQKVYNQARARAGIEQGAGFHTLRHSLATHLFDAGVDPHTLQLLLGHCSIKTTLKYVNVSRRHFMHIRSPLDLLCFEGPISRL
jgi:site-specific recombinase XerD